MKNSVTISLFSFLFLTISCLKEDDGTIYIPPIQGDELAPEIGGPNQPNQVWIDLSTGEMKGTNRTSWDLGFYTGNQFAVILNTSALMSASPVEGYNELAEINSTNMAGLMSVVQVANFDPENINYIDDVKGNYLNNGTIIHEENTIYLINLGYNIATGPFQPGHSYAAGTLRGWKKIKVSTEGDGYRLEYADLDSTETNEIHLEKDDNYNFTFFSLVTEQVMDIQPPKKDWDLCFTVFVNQVSDNNGNNSGSYIFTDFVMTNTMANTGVYQVVTDETTLLTDFNEFSISDIDESLFVYDDHRAIGSNWRIVPGAIVRKDRFYVLKDPNGVLFKLRFISMSRPDETNPDQFWRGYPVFEFEPL